METKSNRSYFYKHVRVLRLKWRHLAPCVYRRLQLTFTSGGERNKQGESGTPPPSFPATSPAHSRVLVLHPSVIIAAHLSSSPLQGASLT